MPSLTVDQRIAQRLTANGLADTLAALPPRRTISSHTLAEVGIAAALGPDVVRGALEKQAHSSTASLPRIVLAHRATSESTDSPAVAADLEIVELIGQGGMGHVFLARQHSLGRDVAIKRPKDTADVMSALGGLLHEARMMGALEHPGIVPVHALGLDEAGLPILVMKRIEGVSFRVLLDDPKHPGWQTISATASDRMEASIELLMNVCQSLAFAHHRGVVHRDIKPENIMVGAYGEVYLCDWGIATRINEQNPSDVIVGTPIYMAPEMLLGEPVDVRTDVYLLGAMLHELLTGRARHEAKSLMETFHSVAVSAPYEYDAAVAPDLAQLCNQAMSLNPAERHVSVEAFRKELARHLQRRGAMVFCEAALERLRAFDALMHAAPDMSVPEDLAGAYRCSAEARFGFGQSLRVYPELDAAKRGLEKVVMGLFDLELRQKHVETAAVLLDELAEPPLELVQRLADARDQARATHLETERLRAIARDLDPAVAARSRMYLLSTLTVCALLLVVFITWRGAEKPISSADTVAYSGFMVLLTGTLTVIFHRRVWQTLFNRRMVAFIFCTMASLFLHRLAALYIGDGAPEILRTDIFMMLAMCMAGMVTFERRIVAIVVVIAAAAVGVAARPDLVVRIFQTMTILTIPATLWVWKAPRDAHADSAVPRA